MPAARAKACTHASTKTCWYVRAGALPPRSLGHSLTRSLAVRLCCAAGTQNKYGWARSATCFNSIHTDSSLFGIYGTADVADAPALADTLLNECRKMCGPVRSLDLSRAKNQLKSSVFMQLESRSLMLEDIGRQLLTYGRVQTPFEISALIDAVTEQDIIRVAKAMLDTKPSFAAVGDLTTLPTPEQMTMRLLAS